MREIISPSGALMFLFALTFPTGRLDTNGLFRAKFVETLPNRLKGFAYFRSVALNHPQIIQAGIFQQAIHIPSRSRGRERR